MGGLFGGNKQVTTQESSTVNTSTVNNNVPVNVQNSVTNGISPDQQAALMTVGTANAFAQNVIHGYDTLTGAGAAVAVSNPTLTLIVGGFIAVAVILAIVKG